MIKSKLLVAIAAFSVFSANLFASLNVSSDRDRISIKDGKGLSDEKPRHLKSPCRIPFEVWVDSFTSIMEVYFLGDIGELEISVVNIYTGESVDAVVDSSEGQIMMPVSGTAGLYSVSFLLPDGKEYYGEFEL